MEPFSEFDIPRRSRFSGGLPEIGVHVLSEYVFCPRAAMLARESGDDSGDEEPTLGPRLDWMGDYDEHRFAEALHSAYGDLRLWFTLMAPAMLLVLILWFSIAPIAGLAATLPLFYLVTKSWETLLQIIHLVRERAMFQAAVPATIDLNPQNITQVNWWSLRKAGFDCVKPDHLRDPGERLTGRPWRELIKGRQLRIPVVHKRRGERNWGMQHIVRMMAYCRLIETCEGGSAPFGVLMFAGSYDCLIIPNTAAHQAEYQRYLADAREFLPLYSTGKSMPAPPRDNRCSGCHWGKPRPQTAGSETILNGLRVKPLGTKANNGIIYHCSCGDRFESVPPHDDSVQLGIAQRR